MLRVLATGRAEILRFGPGSPFLDLTLPCGGGLEILVVPEPDPEVLREALGRLTNRQPVVLGVSVDEGIHLADPSQIVEPEWQMGRFYARHEPDLRILIAGYGDETRALARFARAYGAEVEVLSPNNDLLHDLADVTKKQTKLKFIQSCGAALELDSHSALVLLFHEHDWETSLLIEAARQECLYIGAMGSRQTHFQRLEVLQANGVTLAQLGRIRGPIGLISATRDLATLALSVLAEVVEAYQKKLKNTQVLDFSRKPVSPIRRTVQLDNAPARAAF
jgi:xanthine dehydrogenase accessory factor